MAKYILFVCTGNTCRSQIAEALAQYWYPQQKFESAGVQAKVGHGATDHVVNLLADRDIDWQGTSQALTAELLAQASHVWCMTQAHCDRVNSMAQALAQTARPEVARLDKGRDISDPWGGDEACYEQTLHEVAAALKHSLED